MYDEMFEYVREVLDTYDSEGGRSQYKIYFNRLKHIKRVYKNVHNIYRELEDKLKQEIDLEALEIATIFHDSGYGQIEHKNHAFMSEKICRNYLIQHNYTKEKIDFISYIVGNHSNKELLHIEDTPMELVILMEADLLDVIGAHGIVMDVWMEALQENASFESMLDHIKKFTYDEMCTRKLRTEPGKRLWDEKKALTTEFVRQYEIDLQE